MATIGATTSPSNVNMTVGARLSGATVSPAHSTGCGPESELENILSLSAEAPIPTSPTPPDLAGLVYKLPPWSSPARVKQTNGISVTPTSNHTGLPGSSLRVGPGLVLLTAGSWV